MNEKRFFICCMLAGIFFLVLWATFSDFSPKNEFTVEQFQEICEENRYDVMKEDRAEISMRASKGSIHITLYIFEDVNNAKNYMDKCYEDAKGWQKGVRLSLFERDRFSYAKWGNYNIITRNGKTLIFSTANANEGEFMWYSKLDSIDRKLTKSGRINIWFMVMALMFFMVAALRGIVAIRHHTKH